MSVLEILYALSAEEKYTIIFRQFHKFNWVSLLAYLLLFILARIVLKADKDHIAYNSISPLQKLIGAALLIIGLADIIHYQHFINKFDGFSFFPHKRKLALSGVIKIAFSLYIFNLAYYYENLFTNKAITQTEQNEEHN